MAYIVDLNDGEPDVPITFIRSKADCPNNETNTTQILLYLRHGKRDAKELKKSSNLQKQIQKS